VNPQNQSKADPSVASSPILWIRTLAAPYLRGYRAAPETRGGLRGYRFLAPGANLARARRGFFVGYIIKALTISIFNRSRRNALFSPLSNR
jgi:hypothetical protein